MYTRSYYPDNEKISIPENYDGNAFREDISSISKEDAGEPMKENAFTMPYNESTEKAEPTSSEPKGRKGDTGQGYISAFLQKLPISNLFGKTDFFKNAHLDFGTEELLIIGIALFLLFSKGGDTECAIMLLLLLLIK